MGSRCFVVALLVAVSAASVAAQVCGDADNDRAVDVIDASNVARAAVGLASACAALDPVCDVNGDGLINVLDAANVARGAVNLPAQLTCGSGIGTVFIGFERTSGVGDRRLDLAFAPIPGAESVLGPPVGRAVISPGRIATYSVAYDLEAGAEEASLIIAARDANTNELLDGFFEIDLPAMAGTAEFQLRTAPGLRSVVVEFFTRSSVSVSAISPIGLAPPPAFQATPTPLPPAPTCAALPTPTTQPTPAPARLDPRGGGAPCESDADCPGGAFGVCPGRESCLGGEEAGSACSRDEECPGGGVCRLALLCLGGSLDSRSVCRVDSDCAAGTCPVTRRCGIGPKEETPCRTGAICGDAPCLPVGQRCVGGSRADQLCGGDEECPAGFCPDLLGCSGGPNADRPCAFNSECPDGLCAPD